MLTNIGFKLLCEAERNGKLPVDASFADPLPVKAKRKALATNYLAACTIKDEKAKHKALRALGFDPL